MRSKVTRRSSVRRSAGRRRRDALLLQFLENEGVHGIAHPGAIGRGRRHRLRFVKRPLPARGGEIIGRLFRRRVRVIRCAPRIGRAHFHPRREIGDLGFVQRFLRRHGEILVQTPHGFDEQTLLRIAGDDGRAAVPARAQALARIQAQAALQLLRLGAVALVAALHEHGADALFEELRSVFIGGSDSRQGERTAAERRRDGQSCRSKDSAEHPWLRLQAIEIFPPAIQVDLHPTFRRDPGRRREDLSASRDARAP
jgi:hypothetical protein